MAFAHYLAMDFGTSSGRGILAGFDGTSVHLEEIHRFDNYYVDLNGVYYWNVLGMFNEIIIALEKASRILKGYESLSIGIDAWGTDFGLIDAGGRLLSGVRCTKNMDERSARKVFEKVPENVLYSHTGVQTIYGNTVFQLYERLLEKDTALQNADALLMLPGLLAYFLTGRVSCEYSIATTSMLLNPVKKDWDHELIAMLGLPGHIFPRIEYAAKKRYPVLESIKKQTGWHDLHYVTVGTHDTASAVAATPLEEGEAFCSSGTWSVIGVETDEPDLTEKAYTAAFANEGTVDGRIRLLKNDVGMWILQECKREWERQGIRFKWDDIVSEAEKAAPFRSLIHIEDPIFYNSGGMCEKIKTYCKKTGQPIPESIGEIARCVYESIALRHAATLGHLEQLRGTGINAMRIVGGGSQNRFLNQMAANAARIPVHAGLAEAAGVGNALIQAVADGKIENPGRIRQVVKNSFAFESFLPQDKDLWDMAYSKYLSIFHK